MVSKIVLVEGYHGYWDATVYHFDGRSKLHHNYKSKEQALKVLRRIYRFKLNQIDIITKPHKRMGPLH